MLSSTQHFDCSFLSRITTSKEENEHEQPVHGEVTHWRRLLHSVLGLVVSLAEIWQMSALSLWGGADGYQEIRETTSVTKIVIKMETNTNQVKKLLLSLFAMLLPLLASGHDFEVDGIYYNITSSTELTVEVTYRGGAYNSYNNEYKGTVTIPPTVIYNEAEYRVTSIGDWTFWNCSLTAITIPKSVTSIKDAAFYYCHLPSITIPESVTNIGYRAFFCCSSLTTIAIPKSVTSIGDEAFLGCQNLTSIIMPEGITSIGSSTFEGCSSLTSINIPESITNIGNSAFERCSSLASINIPEGVTSIGSYAFYGCSSLTSITIPEGVTRIESRTFKNCSNLTSISFSESMESVGIDAFFECYSLHTITIPRNVTSIGEDAFYGCRPHTVINYSALPIKKGNSSYGYVAYSAKRVLDGNCLVSIGDYQFYTSEGVNYLANYIGDDCSLVLPNSHNGENYKIQDYAFYEHKEIQSLTIGNGVISIGSKAFSTTPVKTIWLTNTPPEGHTYAAGTINYVANEDYVNLNEVEIYPYLSSIFEVEGVKYVPVSPSERTCDAIDYSYAESVDAINIRETASFKGIEMRVRKVMPYAFHGGKNITEVSLNIRGEICDEAFKNCSSLEKLILRENITSLGKKVFQDCSSLQNITIPNSVESMGEYCFGGCNALQQATLGSGLKKVDKYVFSNCTSLKDIQIGESIRDIETYAFKGCTSLYSIIIPQATNNVCDYSFAGCSQLANVIIENRNTQLSLGSNGSSALFADCPLDSVYIGGKIAYNTDSSKGYSPFYRNASLRTVVITDEESQIYDNEFYGCTALKNVSVGNGVTSIGDYAFSGCNSLEALSFGSGIKEIGTEAFSDCNNVTQIVSSAVYPPTCGLQALDDINKWDCQLNVPIGYKEAYTEAEQWKEFFFIEDNVVVPYYALTFVVDSIVYQVDSLPCGEFIIIPDEPIKEGHTFSGWSEAPETMPASDVTISGSFAINSYILEYIVDEEIYKTDTITYGDSIAVIAPLVKEGYTFSGWSEAPVVMPADSVIITGSFAINSYLLTYTVDGETVQADSVVYGTEITVVDEPIKEGYTFSGWSEAPETMPANDVTISGTFTINKYLVTFKIGDEIIESDSLEYGATIVVPEAPEKEGHTFNGWGEVPETVPAKDVTIEGRYSLNSYQLVYMVDGETVQTDSVAYGTKIALIDEPTKEGYTFSGWSEAPETMPAEDVTISGTFTINKYLVTFKIGDEIIAADSLEYGATIVAPETPEKEGHTFNGWGEVPETVPANDVTIEGSYSVNSYLLSHMVDGDIIQTDSVAYGTAITLLDEPTKEGYTFSGWSEVPETMPAEDVTISGTFTINKYLVTFKINGEVIAADSLEYGTVVVAPEAPEEEGHTFNGWGEVPETVPANDVTIEGSYSVNSYLLSHMVDGDIIQTDSVAYGTAITLLDEPTKEGYTFSGWSEVPETMPASDVTISGSFCINQYTVTYVIDGEVFATDTITYDDNIPLPDVPAKEGYDFAWTDEIPETMPAKDIVINGSYTTGILNAIVEEDVLYIYTTDGRRVNELQKGLNIVLLKDGSIRKVFVE